MGVKENIESLDLMDLLPTIKSKISSIEITPLPFPRIPRR